MQIFKEKIFYLDEKFSKYGFVKKYEFQII